MIHVVQTEDRAWADRPCECGRPAAYYIPNRWRTYCVTCAASLSVRNRLLPIEAKRHG
jgi:hypothetical protein